MIHASVLKRHENILAQRDLYKNVHSCLNYNSYLTEVTQGSVIRIMDKLWCFYIAKYYVATKKKNEPLISG